MRINKKVLFENLDRFIPILIKHFQYSIKDINNYIELTEFEKSIISKKDFKKLTKN